jgi:hypothetical protein
MEYELVPGPLRESTEDASWSSLAQNERKMVLITDRCIIAGRLAYEPRPGGKASALKSHLRQSGKCDSNEISYF